MTPWADLLAGVTGGHASATTGMVIFGGAALVAVLQLFGRRR